MNMADLLHIAPGLNGAALRGQLRTDEPMARHVSWRSGGRAARCYVPADIEDLAAFLRGLPVDEPLCFVGLGSNLLVRDGGFRGTVVLMHNSHSAMRMEGELVFAGAGALLNLLNAPSAVLQLGQPYLQVLALALLLDAFHASMAAVMVSGGVHGAVL